MARSRKTEDLLAALWRARDELQADPDHEEALELLRHTLQKGGSLPAAAAAEIIGALETDPLVECLTEAFTRFMKDPVRNDKLCRAKKAIAEALYCSGAAGIEVEEVFLAGLRHVQTEPRYGKDEDTAAELRGVCAMGLVRMLHPRAMVEVADLLADPEPAARRLAARALGYAGQYAGVPLLRFKALTGDEDPEVTARCLSALLALAPDSSLPFVARFLESRDAALAEAAALVLGESRHEGAFEILTAWLERIVDHMSRRVGLLAIGMLRMDQAVEHLVAIVAEGAPEDTLAAAEALAIYHHDPAVRERVEAAADGRGDAVRKAVLAAFDPDPETG